MEIRPAKRSFWCRAQIACGFAIYFVLLFNVVFMQKVTDGAQTTAMFVVFSVLISLMVIVLFALGKVVFKTSHSITAVRLLTDSLLLYILSEAVFFCFGGEFSVFGMMYKLHIYTDSYADIVLFRENRDFAFSISSLIAAGLLFIQQIIFRRKVTDDTDIPH